MASAEDELEQTRRKLAAAEAMIAEKDAEIERLSRSASPRSASPRPFSRLPPGVPAKGSPRMGSPRPRASSPRGRSPPRSPRAPSPVAFGSTTKRKPLDFFTASMRGGPLTEPLPQRGLTEYERMNPREAIKGPSLLTRARFGAKKSEWERFNSLDLDSMNFLEDDNPFNDPFKYHPFKGMAFPPSDYIGPDDPRETDDLQTLRPHNALRLRFVYGYTTRNGSRSNLFYNADGHVVYHAAALGIVYDKKTHEQYHFHGHDDDITALDLSPRDRLTVVTGQLGKEPKIIVWSSRPEKGSSNLPLLCVINGDHKRAIIALSFSANGEFIASMGNDNNRSIAIYQWGIDRKLEKMRVGIDKGHTDEVYQLAFNPVTNHVVAGGKKLLRFFGLKDGALSDVEKDARAAAKAGGSHTPALSESESKIWAKKGTFGAERGAQDILSIAFDNDGVTYAGNGEGFIFRFREQATDLAVKAHPLADGSTGWNAGWKYCRVTALWFDPKEKRLISSGDDGWIHEWKPCEWDKGSKFQKPVKGRSLNLNRFVLHHLQGQICKMDDKELEKANPNRGRPAAANAIYGDDQGNLLIGTVCNEIYEINLNECNEEKKANTPLCIMQGHFEEMWGLTVHPQRPEFVTCAEDETLRVWSMKDRQLIGMVALPGPLRCADYSPNGVWLAVGFGGGDKSNRANGKWAILNADPTSLKTVFAPRQERFERCSEIRFSPDGQWLAVANADNGIDIYRAPAEDLNHCEPPKRVCKFEGHSSFVNHIDWSEDSMKLQSNCGAHELLYWRLYDEDANAKVLRWRPHQEKSSSNMRDEKWSTQTCIYGWNVRGLWPEGADGTDINACARSNSGPLRADPNRLTGDMIVTSDDFGKVKLFRYPCIKAYAAFKPYSGHSSHVTNISFSSDDRCVVSVGGEDAAVFQWDVIKE